MSEVQAATGNGTTATKSAHTGLDQIVLVDLKDVQIDPTFNARSGLWVEDKGDGKDGEDEGFPGLINSIQAQGQDYPVDLILNPNKGDSRKYFLVTGFRRCEAIQRSHAANAKIPNLPSGKVKAVIKTLSMSEAHALNIRENAERQDLKGPDLAWGIQRMIADKMTDSEIAAQLGKSQGYISRLHRIMALPQKYTKAWREGTDLEGKGGPRHLSTMQMQAVAEKTTAEDRDTTYLAFFSGGSGTGANVKGKDAWIKSSVAHAEKVGTALGAMVREALLTAKVGESFGDFMTVVQACVKMGRKGKNATVPQHKKIAKAALEAFVAARDLEIKEEEEEEEEDEE